MPVNFLKTHGHASAISSLLEIFSASLPPQQKKNCNFWLNILPLDFDFSSGPIVNHIHYSCDSIFFIPHSFLETMQGLMEILLVSRISEFSYLQREKLSRPLHFNLYINHCQEKLSQAFFTLLISIL